MNKLKFSKISVEKSYCLSANQAIIAYQKNSKNRIIIRGPGIFMLEPSEWYYFHRILLFYLIIEAIILCNKRVHKFSWHGEEEQHKARYLPNKNQFNILNFAPDQLYFNVFNHFK